MTAWRAWASVAALAVLAKAFAFLREPVIAATFGTNAAADAYYVAIGLPFLFFNLLGIPFSLWLTARLAPAENKTFYRRSVLWGFTVSVLLAALLALFPHIAVQAYAPGLEGARLEHAAMLTRLGALALPALVLQVVCGARLYAEHRFVTVYAWVGAGSFVGFLGVLLLTPAYGAAGAVVAFAATWWTAALGLLAQVARPLAKATTTASAPPMGGEHAGPGVAYRAFILQLFLQGNGLLVYTFASQLRVGDIAATLFAGRIIMAIYETIVLTAGVLVFPGIARFMHAGDEPAAGRAVANALTWLVPVTVGFMVLLAVAGPELVTIIYQRRAFDARAAALVSQALLGYTPYILGITLVEILHRAVVLRSRLLGYLTVFGTGLFVNWIASVFLVPQLGIMGVGLGSAIGMLAAAAGLWLYAQRRLSSLDPRRISLLIARTCAAAAGVLLLLLPVRGIITAAPPASLAGAVLRLTVETVAVGGAFAGLLFLLGHRPRRRLAA